MTRPKRTGSGVLMLMVGVVLAVGCGMALTGTVLTPAKSWVFTAVVGALTAALFRSISAVVGAVAISLVLCFLVAPNIPGLTG